MDADTVREVEFGRKLRGYDMAEVDAFLEKVEKTLRFQELECENLRNRLEEMSGARDAQGEKLEALNWSMASLREENARLARDLHAAQAAAAKEPAPKELAIPQSHPNRKMDFAKSLKGAGEAAKKMTESLKSLAKK